MLCYGSRGWLCSRHVEAVMISCVLLSSVSFSQVFVRSVQAAMVSLVVGRKVESRCGMIR